MYVNFGQSKLAGDLSGECSKIQKDQKFHGISWDFCDPKTSP